MSDRVASYVDAGASPKFAAWMKKVDLAVSKKVGLSVFDLADIAFYDLWKDGVSPARAAALAIKESM